jgi:hypothetical protein
MGREPINPFNPVFGTVFGSVFRPVTLPSYAVNNFEPALVFDFKGNYFRTDCDCLYLRSIYNSHTSIFSHYGECLWYSGDCR